MNNNNGYLGPLGLIEIVRAGLSAVDYHWPSHSYKSYLTKIPHKLNISHHRYEFSITLLFTKNYIVHNKRNIKDYYYLQDLEIYSIISNK